MLLAISQLKIAKHLWIMWRYNAKFQKTLEVNIRARRYKTFLTISEKKASKVVCTIRSMSCDWCSLSHYPSRPSSHSILQTILAFNPPDHPCIQSSRQSLHSILQTILAFNPPDNPCIQSSRPSLHSILQTILAFNPPDHPCIQSSRPSLHSILQTILAFNPPDHPCIQSSRPSLHSILQTILAFNPPDHPCNRTRLEKANSSSFAPTVLTFCYLLN